MGFYGQMPLDKSVCNLVTKRLLNVKELIFQAVPATATVGAWESKT